MIEWVYQIVRRILDIRFVRFAIVGGSSGLVYAVAVAVLIEVGGVGATIASSIGYLLSIPANFFGQKLFTFQSEASIADEIGPFLLVQAVNLCVSAFVMWALVSYSDLHFAFGIVLVIATIPFATYLSLSLLVFTTKRS